MKLLMCPESCWRGGRQEGSKREVFQNSRWEPVPAAHAAHGSTGRTGAEWGTVPPSLHRRPPSCACGAQGRGCIGKPCGMPMGSPGGCVAPTVTRPRVPEALGTSPLPVWPALTPHEPASGSCPRPCCRPRWGHVPGDKAGDTRCVVPALLPHPSPATPHGGDHLCPPSCPHRGDGQHPPSPCHHPPTPWGWGTGAWPWAVGRGLRGARGAPGCSPRRRAHFHLPAQPQAAATCFALGLSGLRHSWLARQG